MMGLAIIGMLLATVVMGTVIYFMIKAAGSLAPWIPSKTSMAEKAFAYIRPTPDMRFADLGCGDGRIVFFAAQNYGLSSIGYEVSLLPYLCAKIRQFLHRTVPVEIYWQDLFTASLNSFDIVYVYGLPQALHSKLQPKLRRELKPGAYVISYNFSLAGEQPLIEFHDRWRNLFVYRF